MAGCDPCTPRSCRSVILFLFWGKKGLLSRYDTTDTLVDTFFRGSSRMSKCVSHLNVLSGFVDLGMAACQFEGEDSVDTSRIRHGIRMFKRDDETSVQVVQDHWHVGYLSLFFPSSSRFGLVADLRWPTPWKRPTWNLKTTGL